MLVASGVQLQLDNSINGNLTIPNSIALTGNGIGIGVAGAGSANSNGAYQGLGALYNLHGNNILSGNVELTTNGAVTYIGVALGNTLNVSGTMASETVTAAGSPFEKVGQGTLELSGNTDNMVYGTNVVLQGTLLLDKTGNNPLTGNPNAAFHGGISIGDNLQGTYASVVKLMAPNQIPATDFYGDGLNTVTLNPSGELNLNGFNDTIGALTLTNGQNFSPMVTTGSGTLTVWGTITQSTGTEGSGPMQSGASASMPAIIAGNLSLGGLGFGGSFSGGAAQTSRTIAVNPTANPGPASPSGTDVDLWISANISGGPDVALTKTLTGTLRLTGNNTYLGSTLLTAGGISVGGNSPFGNTGADVDFGNVSMSVGQGFTSTGVTISNPISLDLATTLTTFGSAPITFAGSTVSLANVNNATVVHTINVDDPNQTVTIADTITEGIFGPQSLTKGGEGTLALSGADTFSGTTTITNGGGSLVLTGGGTLSDVSSFVLGENTTLELDDSVLHQSSRINPAAPITSQGGIIWLNGAAGVATSQTLGTVDVLGNGTATGAGGSNTIFKTTVGAGGTVSLTISTIVLGAPSSLLFDGTNADLSANGANQINFGIAPTGMIGGILPYASVVGPSVRNVATLVSTANGAAVTALPVADEVTNVNQANSLSNLYISTNQTLTTPLTVNSLVLANGATLAGPGLTVTSGRVVFAGNTGTTDNLDATILNLAAASSYITTAPGITGDINSSITGAATSLTTDSLITGTSPTATTGKLVLAGANQFLGFTSIVSGIVDLQNSAALGSANAPVYVRAALCSCSMPKPAGRSPSASSP